MMKVCAKGHYELAYNSVNTVYVPRNCPACDALDEKARLEDEVKVILDELAATKLALERRQEGAA